MWVDSGAGREAAGSQPRAGEIPSVREKSDRANPAGKRHGDKTTDKSEWAANIFTTGVAEVGRLIFREATSRRSDSVPKLRPSVREIQNLSALFKITEENPRSIG